MPPPDAVERIVTRYVPLGSFVGSNAAETSTGSSIPAPAPSASVVSPVVPARVAVIFQDATAWPSGGAIVVAIVTGVVTTVPSAGLGASITGRASPPPPPPPPPPAVGPTGVVVGSMAPGWPGSSDRIG